MNKRKLEISGDVKSYLEKMRDIFTELSLNNEHLSKVIAGDGCGGICRFTCSWFCRPSCEAQCTESCDQTCKGGCLRASVAVNCPQYIIWVL